MDDVIIIILTLVLTVVAAVNQSKKRKQQAPPEAGEDTDIWEDILQTGKQKPFPSTQREPITIKEDTRQRQAAEMDRSRRVPSWNTKTIKKPPSIFNSENEGGRNEDILRSSKIGQAPDATAVKEGSGKPVLEDFSLRKAVIYAEIINPKYF